MSKPLTFSPNKPRVVYPWQKTAESVTMAQGRMIGNNFRVATAEVDDGHDAVGGTSQSTTGEESQLVSEGTSSLDTSAVREDGSSSV